MRIPRSTIVMAVLTCIPFGFAIRDYLSGKDKVVIDSDDEDYSSASDSSDSDEEYAKYRAERDAEEAREEARKEERKATMMAAFDRLVGRSPATLGPAFGTIKPGMTDTELGKADDATTALRKLAREHELVITYNDSDGVLQDVSITPSESADDSSLLCEVAREKLENAWESPATVKGTDVWLDPAAGIRFELNDRYECSLVFRRFVSVEKWIDKKSSVVPVSAIGQPIAKLVKSLEPQRLDLSDAEYGVQWTAPGLGKGVDATQLTAHVAGGKVVAIAAKVNVSSETLGQLGEQLEGVFGRSSEDDYGNRTYGKKPQVTVSEDYSESTIEILVGKIPEE